MARENTLVKQEPQSLVQSDQRPAVTPACDIYENNDEVLLVADLPGVANDALKINLDGDELTLEGRRDDVTGEPLVAEYGGCDFRRRFKLPLGIDGGKVKAELRNGVLALHLPKAEAVKPRQVAVRAG